MPLSGQQSDTELLDSPRFPAESPAENLTGKPSLARRNLYALTLDVTGFCIGLAFLDSSAVLPLLLQRLGAGGTLIGAYAMSRSLTFGLSQIFVAYITQGMARQKPALAWIAALTRLPLIALPFFLLHAADSPAARAAALFAAFALLGIWSLGDGLGYVPWMEIVARSLSEKTRGRFFTTTSLLASIVGVATAIFLVRPILSAAGLPFPKNYALLTALFVLMMLVSLIGCLLIQEPPLPKTEKPAERLTFRDYFSRLPEILRTNPTFTRLSNVELLVAFGAAAQPFYVLEAKERFHLNDSWGATYQAMMAVSVILMMPVWTYLTEKRGAASAVRGVALGCLLTPILALTAGRISPWCYGLVFLSLGGSLGTGMWIVINHYLLSHAADAERPVLVGLLNLRSTPAAFYPLLGGLLVPSAGVLKWHDIPILFVITAAVVAVGFGFALRLPEPQKQL